MFRKSIAGILITLMVAFPATHALADDGVKNIPVNLEVVQTQFRTEQDVNGDGEVAFMLTSHWKGSPGRAESKGLSEVGSPLADTSGCPDDFIFPFALPMLVWQDTLVFNDLSMLFIAGVDGLFCFDLVTAAGVASVDVNVVGGTGRFAGASGSLFLHFPETYVFYFEYAAAAGTMTGTVQVPAGGS